MRSKGAGPSGGSIGLPPFSLARKSLYLLLACLFLAVASPLYPFETRVARVIDGDTVVTTEGKALRYLGINTPERGEAFYEEAKVENRHLVEGKRVRLEFEEGQREDKYGRWLAYLHVDGAMVNEVLLRKGLAHLFCIQPIKYYRRFLTLQEEARKEKRGIWGDRPGPLRITSLHADAPGDDRLNLNGEYVRICNISPAPVDLKGFSIRDRFGHIYIFPGGVLRPGYTALLLSGNGRDVLEGPELRFYWGSPYPIWNNKGDTAYLYDPQRRLISRFEYRRRR